MVRVIMSLQHLWEDPPTLADYLAKQLNTGCLAMVVGAGISLPFGLPDWHTLIKRLYQLKGATPDFTKRYEALAEEFKLTYFRDDANGYLDAVSSALYEGVRIDFETLHRSHTLAAIAALTMASCRGNIAHLITFNFDNLLEIYLAYHGFSVLSIFTESNWAQRTDITIYHPHGFLPAEGGVDKSNRIILDQKSYAEAIGKEGSIWYQRLLTIFRTHTCLFLGLSGDDQNLDSLLTAARENHAYHLDNTAFWGVRFTTDQDPGTSLRWEDRGIFTKVVANYETELPNFLFRICQEAAALEKKIKGY